MANNGFLLVDTLPFALRYTTQVRKRTVYLELLQASADYFHTKLNDPGLTWADKPQIALAFKWHGRRVIEAYSGEIVLPSGHIPLNEKTQIAADGSGYTNTQRLREIWGL